MDVLIYLWLYKKFNIMVECVMWVYYVLDGYYGLDKFGLKNIYIKIIL